MNKRLIWIILSLSLLCITGGELYWSGYIRDNYSLTGKTPDLDVLWLFFILMIIAVVIVSIKKIFCKLPFQYIAKIIIITILFCCVFEGGYLYGKYGSVNNQKETDYIKNEWIVGISLNELKQYI